MAITKEDKLEIIKEYGENDGDSGKDAVQVALLTQRIVHLTEHLKKNKKDYSTKRGLLKLVGRRRKLLNYIEKRDVKRYRELIAKLGFRN